MEATTTCTQCDAPAVTGSKMCDIHSATLEPHEAKPAVGKNEEFENIPGDRYEIICRIGNGAFGSVYKARDTFLNRSVAVKSIRLDTSLDPEQKAALNKRFVREAQVAAQLQHPNIVTIHDIVFTPEMGFIIMEFIEGATLESLMAKRQLDLRKTLAIVTQVARALHYAHDHSVIHRDIKPANIMITPDFEARITDFGIAKSDSSTHLTMSGSLVGTPDYMSPEQAKGEDVSSSSDLFSLGCILYESIAQEKPFRGGSLTGVLLRIVNDDPLAADVWKAVNAPPELTAVLELALAKKKEARFPTGSAFAEALEKVSPDAALGPGPEDTKAAKSVNGGAGEKRSSGDDSRAAAHSQSDALPPAQLAPEEVTRLKSDSRPLVFAVSLNDELQNISLTPGQGFILSRIDGSSRVNDILAVAAVPEAEAAATITELLERKLIAFEGDLEPPVDSSSDEFSQAKGRPSKAAESEQGDATAEPAPVDGEPRSLADELDAAEALVQMDVADGETPGEEVEIDVEAAVEEAARQEAESRVDGFGGSERKSTDDVDPLIEEMESILELGGREKANLQGIKGVNSPEDPKQAFQKISNRFEQESRPLDIGDENRQKLDQLFAAATKAIEAKTHAAPPSTAKAASSDTSSTGRFDKKKYAMELYQLGKSSFEVGEYWDAIQLARQAGEIDPNRAEYHYLLGMGLMQNRNWFKEAEESLLKAAELDESNADAFGRLAALYAAQEMPSRAEAMIDKAKALDPDYQIPQIS